MERGSGGAGSSRTRSTRSAWDCRRRRSESVNTASGCSARMESRSRTMCCTSRIHKGLALAATLLFAAQGSATARGRDLDRRSETARKLTNLGVALVAHGQTEEALRDYREALTIERALGDRRGEAETLGN